MKQHKMFLVIVMLLVFGLSTIGLVGGTNSTVSAGGPISTQPPAKATFEALEQVANATAEASPHGVKHPELKPSASCPRPLPQTGIIDSFSFGPFFGGKNLINYASVESSKGTYYQIWAGAPDDAPQQGLLRVDQEVIDPCAHAAPGNDDISMVDYITPKGPLSITRIEGDTIVFSIANGGTGRFNFVTDQFLP